MNLLAIGDISGRSGRECVKNEIPKLKKEFDIDMVIANGENASGGFGLTRNDYEELINAGVDVITMGNHTWAKNELKNFIDDTNRIVRPANLPSHLPGVGSVVYDIGFYKVGVINLLGRVYMDLADNPFVVVKKEIEKVKKDCDFIVVDFHAEATSEKVAMGFYLDGLVSVVYGTHTHIQTADERIFPNGTGYITDLGMTGPIDSILGVKKEIIINKFVNSVGSKFEVSLEKSEFNGAVFKINNNDKKVEEIVRIRGGRRGVYLR